MLNQSDDLESKILMQGVHIDLTPALQAAIYEKFSILLRHNAWIIRVNVRLILDQTIGKKNLYSATGQIELRGPDIVGNAKAEDAYDVLDILVQKLDDQLRDRHERRKDKRNHPHDVELDAAIPKLESEP